ncbi:MAG: zinc-binding dehydrogenase, partial [Bacillales bacterium]
VQTVRAFGASQVIMSGMTPHRLAAAEHYADHVINAADKDVVEEVKSLTGGLGPDVIIVDPPRSGCDAGLRETMLKADAKKIIYVSCNPSTLAKDLHVLTKKYDIAYIQPVDMFPQTSHVECCALLIKK